MTFVAAHLAPMEERWQRRNEDWRSICEGLVFERGSGDARASKGSGEGEEEPLLSNVDQAESSQGRVNSMFEPASHLFFAGDLNYRTSDTKPSPDDHKDWPQPVGEASDPKHYTNHLPKDQLTRELHARKTLHLLTEPPITFPPTYKYSHAAQKHVAHTVTSAQRTLGDGRVIDTTHLDPRGEEEAWLWAPHRVPSWCDRVLFLDAAKPTVHAYTALPVQPTSDHRPVVLSCSIPRRQVDMERVGSAPFKVRGDWRERRAAARRLELVVGLAAYLSLTWEGEALLAGTIVGIIGGYLALRALLGW